MELETSKEPYKLKLVFSDINEDLNEEDLNNVMKNHSTLLLSLIENANDTIFL